MPKSKKGKSELDIYLSGPECLCSEIKYEISRGKMKIVKEYFTKMSKDEVQAWERYKGIYNDEAEFANMVKDNSGMATEENRNPLGLEAVTAESPDIEASKFMNELTVPKEDEHLTKVNRTKNNSKICPWCSTQRSINLFLKNTNESLEFPYLGRDIICGKCLGEIRVLKKLKQYLWSCNREFNNELWNLCRAGNPSEEAAISKYIKAFNSDQYYSYKYHGEKDYPKTNNPEDMWYVPEYLSHEKHYDFEWQMTLDDYELKYLKEYIGRLAKDKDLSDTISMDMAMKMAKLSLASNQAWENYRQGQCTLKDAQAIQDMFEQQSKTANLAPAKNGAGNSSAGSFSEISQYLENNCAALMTKVSYEKDDIDEIIEIFRNTIKATADNM